MTWKSNSGYAVVAAGILLVVVAVLALIKLQSGLILLLCSAGPIILLVISAIHWAVREKNKPGIVVPTALGIMLICGVLLCVQTSELPSTLSLDDLDTIHIGMRFDEIAREIGGGDWLSDVEFFTVAYDVEGEMQLVLVFEDGIHLSGVALHRPDGTTTAIGSTSTLGVIEQ